MREQTALTKLELTVTLAVIAVLAALLVIPKAVSKQKRITCVGRLMNVGLSFRIFANDNDEKFPMQVSTNKGGTQEYVDMPFSAYTHFRALSNELSVPLIVKCPADNRKSAKTFSELGNGQLGYFVGLYSSQHLPDSILGGDRHLTNGVQPTNGSLNLPANQMSGWTKKPHRSQGT